MEEKKTDRTGPCCTIKIAVGQGGDDRCAGEEGKRVINLTCDPADLKGRTIEIVCRPAPDKD